MITFKTPRGTQPILTTVVSNIQDIINYNYTNAFKMLFESYGVYALLEQDDTIDPDDYSLYVEQINNTALTIYPGVAVTSGLNYFYLDKVMTVNIPASLSTGEHLLFLQHTYAPSTSISTPANNVPSTANATSPSKRLDSCSVAWNTPGINSVLLAKITLGSQGISNVLDLRYTNVLRYNDNLLPGVLANLQSTEVQKFNGNIKVPAFTIYNGNDETTTLTYDIVEKFNLITIPPPKNIRIANITAAPAPGEIRLLIKWDWNDIQGGGSRMFSTLNDSQFRVTSGTTWETNELEFFYLCYGDNVYKILSNTSTDLTVTQLKGNTPINTLVVTGGNYATIHSSVDSWSEIAISAIDFQELYLFGEQTVHQQLQVNLPANQERYRLYLKNYMAVADKGLAEVSDDLTFIADMPLRTPDPDQIVLACYNDSVISVTMGDDWLGNNITFDMCYTTDSSGANFDNAAHFKTLDRSDALFTVGIVSSEKLYLAFRLKYNGIICSEIYRKEFTPLNVRTQKLSRFDFNLDPFMGVLYGNASGINIPVTDDYWTFLLDNTSTGTAEWDTSVYYSAPKSLKLYSDTTEADALSNPISLRTAGRTRNFVLRWKWKQTATYNNNTSYIYIYEAGTYPSTPITYTYLPQQVENAAQWYDASLSFSTAVPEIQIYVRTQEPSEGQATIHWDDFTLTAYDPYNYAISPSIYDIYSGREKGTVYSTSLMGKLLTFRDGQKFTPTSNAYEIDERHVINLADSSGDLISSAIASGIFTYGQSSSSRVVGTFQVPVDSLIYQVDLQIDTSNVAVSSWATLRWTLGDTTETLWTSSDPGISSKELSMRVPRNTPLDFELLNLTYSGGFKGNVTVYYTQLGTPAFRG